MGIAYNGGKERNMFYIVKDIETDEVVEVLECRYVGSQRDKFENGLYRKVDFSRFYIDESEEDPREVGINHE
jgi:hypothetical protein